MACPFVDVLLQGEETILPFSLLDRQITMSGQGTLPCQTESDVNCTKRKRMSSTFRFDDHVSEYRVILPRPVAFFISHIVARFSALSVLVTSFSNLRDRITPRKIALTVAISC
jgi:hypothetical protein